MLHAGRLYYYDYTMYANDHKYFNSILRLLSSGAGLVQHHTCCITENQTGFLNIKKVYWKRQVRPAFRRARGTLSAS